jgi:hypothetical protein
MGQACDVKDGRKHYMDASLMPKLPLHDRKSTIWVAAKKATRHSDRGQDRWNSSDTILETFSEPVQVDELGIT